MVIISIIEFSVCGTIYFFADNPVIFVIETLLVACCLSGTFTMDGKTAVVNADQLNSFKVNYFNES